MKSSGRWRYSFLPVRFIIFDGRLIFLLIFTMVYPRQSTLVITLLVIFIFWLAERAGYTTPQALRFVRGWVAGPVRYAQSPLRRRSMSDFSGVGTKWMD